MSSWIDIDFDKIKLYSKKYKNIKELKQAPMRNIIQVVTKMKPSINKEYLSKWLFDEYYSHKMKGALTNRLKYISNNICYDYIISKCFDNIDLLNNSKTNNILNDNFQNIIKSLYEIDARGTGCFIDYLIRRIICEIKEEKFEDRRADEICNGVREHYDDVYTIDSNEKLWQFKSNSLNFWCISELMDINSNVINGIEDGDFFIEIDRKNEWLKIKYKNTIGYVRYLVPNMYDIVLPKKISGDYNNYIKNKYFIEHIDKHYCIRGCKNKCIKIDFKNECELKCIFPYCQNLCYVKTQNTLKHKTKDILKDIYITSIAHRESFQDFVYQDNFDKIINILDKCEEENFINPLIDLCKKLVKCKNNILCNPCLGSKETPIPADCDLVIDDYLIDIKVAKNNSKYEILQLLGYASMLKYNKKYNIRVNNICILNILNCQYIVYNIENISDNNLFKFIELLTNKYN